MSTKQKKRSEPQLGAAAPVSTRLHPRNRHCGRYDFSRLVEVDAELGSFVALNAHGEMSVDFADPGAVRALNRALLKDWYKVQSWDIPPGSLCPSVPGRADYLHYLADLLAERNRGAIPASRLMQVLDIGTGANCIYPLIGASEYGWRFIATDINPASIANAQGILDANPKLSKKISLRLQPSPTAILAGVVHDDEWFDLTLCNPPFHSSQAEARAGSERKWKNLGRSGDDDKAGPNLNFGGQDLELWCPGGEQAFIAQMIAESAQIATRCFWFSSLVSRSESLPGIYAALKRAGAQEHKTVAMSQGQKQSRLVAWTFLTPVQQAGWRKLRW